MLYFQRPPKGCSHFKINSVLYLALIPSKWPIFFFCPFPQAYKMMLQNDAGSQADIGGS